MACMLMRAHAVPCPAVPAALAPTHMHAQEEWSSALCLLGGRYVSVFRCAALCVFCCIASRFLRAGRIGRTLPPSRPLCQGRG